MGNKKQLNKFGSQLSHSTPRENQGGRTKPSKLSADYIVGLTDGEGSFSIYLNPPNKKHGSINYRVQCRYYIKMREDELPLLEKVKDFWGCGKIYFQKEYRENQRDNYRFEIFNYDLLKNVVVPFFKEHKLEGKRIKDFNLFCQILDLAIKKAHQTKKGLEKIKKLKERLHA
ncbi:MAG: LAGLIDADG family homing endonuclease [Patescibacteria group bacterium]